MIDLNAALEKIREAAMDTEFEDDLWLVGGVVRDELLGRPIKNDIDLVTTGKAADFAEMLYEGKLLDHFPVVYERFGTVMMSVDGIQFEVVTARKESYREKSRKPEVEASTLLDDAMRRDFCCNSLMKSLFTGEVLDLTGHGLEDLAAGILRTPLDPVRTMKDDPLRMLRAVRFGGQLGFNLHPSLIESITANSSALNDISRERIKEEFWKILSLPGAAAASSLQQLEDLGLLSNFLPERPGRTLPEKLKWIASTGPNPLSRTAILLVGSEAAQPGSASLALKRLKFSVEEIRSVQRLIDGLLQSIRTNPNKRSDLVRLLLTLQDQYDSFIEIERSSPAGSVVADALEQVHDLVDIEDMRSPLSGEDLMIALGIGPGPKVGRIMHWLREQVIDGKLQPYDGKRAMQLVRERRFEEPS